MPTLFLIAALAAAPADVPAPLVPWIPWVMHGRPEAGCPFLAGGDGAARCLWPSRLALSADDRGGGFRQEWAVYDARGADVALPGDEKAWPREVKVDGAAAPLLGGVGPRVHLAPGSHVVTGSFAWASAPDSVAVPAETGLVALTLRGKAVAEPSWEGGKLFLGRPKAGEREANRLELSVTRELDDGIPAIATSRIELSVAGKSREELIGPVLPQGFVATALEAPLPVRLDPDGRLRVQVRPGVWDVTLAARSLGPVSELTERALPAPWPPEVVWAFRPESDLRQVAVSGEQVDPKETRLPDEWRSLAAYRLKAGEALRLTQTRRGDETPAPDELELARHLWLDENGRGYSFRDEVTGRMHEGWRLELPPPEELGSVSVNGRAQLVTRLAGGAPGVEIREGKLALEADGRIEGGVGRLPAVGWSHGMRRLSATLSLPPGWRLFHAGGVDRVSQSWLTDWTLWDLFFVLVTALAAGQLLGAWAGAIAIGALVLTHAQPEAPSWLWLLLIGAAALVKALPAGRVARLAKVVQGAIAIWLFVAAAGFAVQQLRQAMYPVLEGAGGARGEAGGGIFGAERPLPGATVDALGGATAEDREALKRKSLVNFAAEAAAPSPTEPVRGHPLTQERRGILGLLGGGSASVSAAKGSSSGESASVYSALADPNAVVSTGPGVPDWSWRTIALSFSGPVDQSQTIRLWLVPPWIERGLAVLRVLLVALLFLVLLGVDPRRLLPAAARGAAPAALLALCCLAGGRARASDFPSKELLDGLGDRLVEKPTCAPDCASFDRLALSADGRLLRLELEAGAAAPTALPLPASPKEWRPSTVTLDGKPAPSLARGDDGTLWIALAPGRHRLVLEGPLPDRDTVSLSLPKTPHVVTAALRGWTLVGVGENGAPEGSLELTRTERPTPGEAAGLQAGTLPGFARVERTLRLGLEWSVDTRLVRTTPPGSPLLLSVPLLPGEEVTSADARVLGGAVQVNLAPDATEASWSGKLPEGSLIALVAPNGVPWVEDWRLDASPIWHATARGIPPIHREDANGARLVEWRPWPGEEVRIAAERPAGVPGPTLTVDESDLTVAPGLRSSSATLALALRSSRGGEHAILLPEAAKLESLQVDGRDLPVRQEGRRVVVPLAAGAERLRLAWRDPEPAGLLFRAPAVDLGVSSVNARTTIDVPEDQWILAVGGPRVGPAVLFWGALGALLLVALALGRLGWAPLGVRDWFVVGLGFTQSSPWAFALFAGFFLALGLRERRQPEGRRAFDFVQILLAGLAVAAVVALALAVQAGLLGRPEMQIAGNGSYADALHWYRDRAGSVLPRPRVIAAPLFAYRLLMLAWALWLASSCVAWARWGWSAFSKGGLWRPRAEAPARAAP